MNELVWTVELESGESFTGTAAAEGEVRILADLPEGRLKSVAAQMHLPRRETDRVFLNGFQSWSHCPERGSRDILRGLSHLPRLGVYVTGFITNEAAESSELQIGDCIVKVEGVEVTTVAEILATVYAYHVGDTVELEVLRDNEMITVSTVLTEQDSNYFEESNN